MWKWLNNLLSEFRDCFSRELSYEWFVIILLGLMLRSDHLGVSSIIRELGINPKSYETMISFFHASSWKIESLRAVWIKILRNSKLIFLDDEMPILIGDGIKSAKEGKKMVGVKKLHQDSENSSKAEYIFGHFFGVTGVLIGNAKKLFCVPVVATIQDGVNLIREWENPDYKKRSHVEQMIFDGCNVASKLGTSILLLDRYFLSRPALMEWIACEQQFGSKLLSIVTKAKSTVIGYEKPSKTSTKQGKGRPKIKGNKIKINDLFADESSFTSAKILMYGEVKSVKYLCVDLLWGEGLYQELRFVLVKYGNTNSILVSTDLTFSPEKIIKLYSMRFKIETTFRAFNQTLAGFKCHFWTSSMPKLNKYLKKGEPNPLENIKNDHEKNKIISSLKATEGFVMFSCIAFGLLQMISLNFYTEIIKSNFRWLRTYSSSFPSEATVADFMRKTIFLGYQKKDILPIMHLIKKKQCQDKELCGF